jgi:hypothetical protein
MTVVFGTVAKNIEGSIFQLIQFLTELANALPDAHFFLYENNSTDGTRKYFPILQSISTNLHIQSETFTNEELLQRSVARSCENNPCRMEMIAYARNKLLTAIQAHGYGRDEDFVVMFDCDMASIPTAPLLERLRAFPDDVDVLFANGLARDGQRYYDMYALRYGNNPFGPELLGETFWKTMPQISIKGSIPVISAFGGLAIYRGYCLNNSRYSAIPTQALDTIYKQLIKQTDYKQIKETHHNGASMGIYLFGQGPDDIFYVNNSGYNFPVVCEHSTFHADIMLRGHGRFRIDPDLKYYSMH